jgi:hypothetical protein
VDEVALQVIGSEGDDVQELDELTGRLYDILLELDVAAVHPVPPAKIPDGSKGIGTAVGGLLVRLGNASILRRVIDAIRDWAARTRRDVEVTMNGDTLKLTGVSSAQQDKIIDAWIARHSNGS